MTRQDRLQTFVSLSVGNWVRQCAADHGVSVSVFIRDLIVAAWQRDNEAKDRPAGLDPRLRPLLSVPPSPLFSLSLSLLALF